MAWPFGIDMLLGADMRVDGGALQTPYRAIQALFVPSFWFLAPHFSFSLSHIPPLPRKLKHTPLPNHSRLVVITYRGVELLLTGTRPLMRTSRQCRGIVDNVEEQRPHGAVDFASGAFPFWISILCLVLDLCLLLHLGCVSSRFFCFAG